MLSLVPCLHRQVPMLPLVTWSSSLLQLAVTLLHNESNDIHGLPLVFFSPPFFPRLQFRQGSPSPSLCDPTTLSKIGFGLFLSWIVFTPFVVFLHLIHQYRSIIILMHLFTLKHNSLNKRNLKGYSLHDFM